MKGLAIILFLAVLVLRNDLQAQKHDYTWMTGYSAGEGGSGDIGISILEFDLFNQMLSIRGDSSIRHFFNSASLAMSDKNGRFLFSSNGTRIYNSTHNWMEGGENLNINEGNGYILTQGVLSLPHPRDSNIYAFFHGRKGYGVWVTQTWYSEIDMQENEGLGKVILTQPLVQDTLQSGKFTAVRHGNGKDWWILFQHYCVLNENCKSNFFYKILLNAEGVQVKEQIIEDNLLTASGAGQAVFTPDGTKYIASHSIRDGIPHVIDIYDFDRCTGQLGNRKQIEIERIFNAEDRGSGLAISSNSRFAYLILFKRIIQFDLWADDIEASAIIVAEYDGFVDVFPTRFLRGQLAPDGKIYICTTNSTRYLHVINNPNEKGLACNVKQHAIKLPTFNSFSIPNHPNYRLGAWEGSSCDTIKSVNVSNTTIFEKASIKLYPNPATDVLNIEINTSTPYQAMEIQVYDLLGKQLGIFNDISSLPLNYPKGLYLVQIWLDQKLVKTEKLIIQE